MRFTSNNYLFGKLIDLEQVTHGSIVTFRTTYVCLTRQNQQSNKNLKKYYLLYERGIHSRMLQIETKVD